MSETPEIGIICGNFDVLHPGYLKMFQEIEDNCEKLFILLHDDPTIERPEKKKPILSVEERTQILKSIRYIDEVAYYTYEDDLLKLLDAYLPDIRFLGDDYRGRTYTGFELNIPIHYLNRDHGWSTTKFKTLIAQSL